MTERLSLVDLLLCVNFCCTAESLCIDTHIHLLFHILFHYVLSQDTDYSSLCYTVKVKSLSRVQLFATPWTLAYQAPRSMGFSRQEYWSGFPFPSPGYLPDPGIKPRSPSLEADALTSEPPEKPIGPSYLACLIYNNFCYLVISDREAHKENLLKLYRQHVLSLESIFFSNFSI